MAPDPEAQASPPTASRHGPGVAHSTIQIPAGANLTLDGIRRLIQQAAQDAQGACMTPPEGHIPWIPELGPARTLVHKNEEQGLIEFYTAPEGLWRQLGTNLPDDSEPLPVTEPTTEGEEE